MLHWSDSVKTSIMMHVIQTRAHVILFLFLHFKKIWRSIHQSVQTNYKPEKTLCKNSNVDSVPSSKLGFINPCNGSGHLHLELPSSKLWHFLKSNVLESTFALFSLHLIKVYLKCGRHLPQNSLYPFSHSKGSLTLLRAALRLPVSLAARWSCDGSGQWAVSRTWWWHSRKAIWREVDSSGMGPLSFTLPLLSAWNKGLMLEVKPRLATKKKQLSSVCDFCA